MGPRHINPVHQSDQAWYSFIDPKKFRGDGKEKSVILYRSVKIESSDWRRNDYPEKINHWGLIQIWCEINWVWKSYSTEVKWKENGSYWGHYDIWKG